MKRGDESTREKLVRELFFEACDFEDVEARDRFLDDACGDDSRLRNEIYTLLSAHKESNTLLERNFLEEFDDSLDSLIGTTIGRYRILEKLGEGGFGEVYRVEQLEPIRRELALKIIKPGMDSREIIRRFESERQALAMLDHQNIAHIVDAGATDSGRPYFVMELACGLPITKYCDQNRLKIDGRLKLIEYICQGVHHAHQKGILHRDLNPSNIIVVQQDGRVIPKIIDFGIAKSLQGHLTGRTIPTRRELFVGTPDYVSPEQFTMNSDELDNRTDIYSLGSILYELVCGSPPFGKERFKHAGLSEINHVLTEVDPEKPSTHIHQSQDEQETLDQRSSTLAKLKTKLRGDLDAIIMKCLEKDRSRRYACVDDLAQDLAAFLDSRPVKASSPGLVYRGIRLLRRTRHVFFGWTAAGLLLIGLIAVLSKPFWGVVYPGKNEKSIAVLPFKDHSRMVENRHFTDGIHEGLIVEVSKIPGLKVIAEPSVREYRDSDKSLNTIANELGVELLLNGAVRWADDSVQLRVQLLDPEDNSHMWANTYIRLLTAENVFDIQYEISTEIASALGVVLLADESESEGQFPTTNLEALEAYYRGLECARNRSIVSTREAIAHFKKAVSIDDTFASAHAALATELLNLIRTSGISLDSMLDEVEAHIARGMEIDSSSSANYVVLAKLKALQRQYPEAESAIDKAIQLDPNNSNAYITKSWLLSLGPGGVLDWEMGSRQSIYLHKKALELDPNNPDALDWMAKVLTAEGRFEEALELRESFVSNRPTDVQALYALAEHLTRETRQFNEAIVLLRKAHSIDPSNTQVLEGLCTNYLLLGDLEAGMYWIDRYIGIQQDVLLRSQRSALKAIHQGTKEDRMESALKGLEEYPKDNNLLWHVTEVDLMNGHENLARLRYANAYPELFSKDAKVDMKVLWQAMNIARVLFLVDNAEQAKLLVDGCWDVLEKSLPDEYPVLKALLDVLDGNHDLAIDELNRFVEAGGSPYQILNRREFDVLGESPAFQSLLAEGDKRMAKQLQQLRQMEADGQLSPIPEMPAKQE
ncbi:MAG: protein kinase [Puniceicoccaceae bacterium]